MKTKILYFSIGIIFAFLISFIFNIASNGNSKKNEAIDNLKVLDEELNEEDVQFTDYDNSIVVNEENYNSYLDFSIEIESLNEEKVLYTIKISGKDGYTINDLHARFDVRLLDEKGNDFAIINVDSVENDKGEFISKHEYYKNTDGSTYDSMDVFVKSLECYAVKK